MGLSFDDDTSIVEAVESVVRFQVAPDDPIPNPETERISQDGSIQFAPDDLNPVPGTRSISQNKGDDDIGGSDDIWMVDR
jgi:hypothetical protein